MRIQERIVERKPNAQLEAKFIAAGISPLAARIAAARLPADVDVARFLRASVADLDHPDGLPDVDVAAARILSALSRKELICVLTDHDADGLNAMAVMTKSLLRMGHPAERLALLTSHRTKEGYGLNHAVTTRLLALPNRPHLVITADCGSSDGERIATLAAAGVDCIVTDHHQLTAATFPDKAVAVVSPARPGCAYPDPTICGAMVAWLLMCHVRGKGVQSGQLPTTTERFRDLLGYVAVATVADCVAIASMNNRAVVREGLRQIKDGEAPWAKQIRARLGGDAGLIDEETIAFQIAPRLAAHGRLDEAMPGAHFLLATTAQDATHWYEVLDQANETRKQIEREITVAGLKAAHELAEQGRVGLAIFLENGMSGVHGISSSRVSETFGLPSAMMTPMASDPALTTISARSVDGCNLKRVLDDVASTAPGLLLSYGGHAAAAGARINTSDRERFQALFDEMVRRQIGDREPSRVFFSDGVLAAEDVSLETVRQIRSLAPYGRGFEQPVYTGSFTAKRPRKVGGDKRHVAMQLEDGDLRVKSIWFGAVEADAPLPVQDGERVRAMLRLGKSVWQGQLRLEVFVERCATTTMAATASG